MMKKFKTIRKGLLISGLSGTLIIASILPAGISYANDDPGTDTREQTGDKLIGENDTGNSIVSEDIQTNNEIILTEESIPGPDTPPTKNTDKPEKDNSDIGDGYYPAKKKEGFIKEKNQWVFYVNNSVHTAGEDIVYGTINGITGWYYIKNGVAVLDHTGVKHNIYGWWYVKDGKVDFNYSGFAKNEYGWWYIEKGNVTFKKNDVIYGTVNGEKAWWNVKGSNVKFNESVEQNQYGWWYIKNGKVDFSYTGVKNNKHGWWYLKNGHVEFGYNGFAKNEYGWWYIEKGNVTFKKNDVIQGTVNGEKAWWNVKGSNVKFNESVEQNKYGWWYIKNGKVDFSYTGDASNVHGTWYIEKGHVNFKYNIAKQIDGKWSGYVNGYKDPSAAVVAHASKDENGKFWEGKAGDQTQEEVYCRTWNDHPWEYVIRAKSPAMAEKIATAMEHAVLNDNIGYDMYQRNTLYHAASKVGWDPGKVTSKVECDCSALVTVACIYAGVNRSAIYQNNSCSYTGNLRKRLYGTGQFYVYSSKDYTKSSAKLKRGDILVEEGEHTAVIVKELGK